RCSDDPDDAQTTSLLRCAGTSRPFRTRGRGMFDLAAGAIDANQGNGGNPRQVTLTKFGEEIIQRVREILRSVDELGDFARASRDRLAGRLRIGMIPTIAPYLLPKVIENLARMHPELDIHVRETLTPKLIKEVVEGRLDTAIVALPVSEPSLTEVVCFSENF